MSSSHVSLLSGNEAVAWAAKDAGVALGAGYPGTPSTEILETFDRLGGRAQWAPNEKVALEVALGAAFAQARAVVTMKHVGLNVAADVLFTAAYTGVTGALVIAVADDPGMASSQNEQDSRRYAEAAGVPMLEPSDAQEAYDFFFTATALSEAFHLPVLFRMTTRVCHAKSVVRRRATPAIPLTPLFAHDRAGRVMIPGHARPAHRRLREKLARLAAQAESADTLRQEDRSPALGIITAGVTYLHAREAAPEASVLKLGQTYPLPLERIRAFAQRVQRCVVLEEGDPFLFQLLKAADIPVEGKLEMYRFGELTVSRVARILSRDLTPETTPPRGKPPQLCPGCPHRRVFEILHQLDCFVAGDIGCYSLGVLPPFEAMDSLVCMGASITTGLGMRQVLPESLARRVVSVIGDSTFVHSGLTGLVEMVYNPPPSGHVVLILDNGTTAMTGLQEHPGTGRRLNGQPGSRLSFEAVARAMGLVNVHVVDPQTETARLASLIQSACASSDLTVIIARRPCLLASKRLREAATPALEGPHE